MTLLIYMNMQNLINKIHNLNEAYVLKTYFEFPKKNGLNFFNIFHSNNRKTFFKYLSIRF